MSRVFFPSHISLSVVRSSLRRRFEQNQQDISFTVMALLPTLGTHILEGMDVEGVTQELQSYSKVPKARIELQHPTAPSESSLTSSVDNVPLQEPDVRSENGSVSVISSVDAIPTEMSTSSTSWVDQFSSQGSSQVFPAPREGGASGSPRSSLGGTLYDSVLSTGSASGSSGLGPSTSPVRNSYVLYSSILSAYTGTTARRA